MPDDMYLRIFKVRGLKCNRLIKIVHSLGGILGPAHPFGVATSSALGFKNMKLSYIKHFDFIETFNTCEFADSNKLAKELAGRFDMPQFAGSDAHVPEYIGMACTEIDAQIRCNNDLISAVKHDILPPDDSSALYRTTVQGSHHPERRALSSRRLTITYPIIRS